MANRKRRKVRTGATARKGVVEESPGQGRPRRDPEKERYWRSVVHEQYDSDLGVRAFCRERGLSEASLYHWRTELRRRDLEEPASDDDSTGGSGSSPGTGRTKTPDAAPAPTFAEVRLTGRETDSSVPTVPEAESGRSVSSEIEVRCGEVSVHFWGGCERGMLREVLDALKGASC